MTGAPARGVLKLTSKSESTLRFEQDARSVALARAVRKWVQDDARSERAFTQAWTTRDSVEPWDGSSGTGFRFAPHDADALAAVLEEAIDVWHDAAARERLIANGMARDDSWDARAEEYRTIYRRAVSSRR